MPDRAMIWALADLHLSHVHPKPMDIFGPRWRDHGARIARAWRERVADDDLVLIAGDVSWATKLDDALEDLRWIDALPGRKVISRGNHDYWWSAERTRRTRRLMPPGITLREADAARYDGAVICGCRGWVTPDTPGFQEGRDRPFYEREVGRLEAALAEAQRLADGVLPIIVMLHFPPFVSGRPTAFSERIAAAGAAACVYGHLHRPDDWASATQGRVAGVYYQLTACDYLGFGPVAVRGLPPPTQRAACSPTAGTPPPG